MRFENVWLLEPLCPLIFLLHESNFQPRRWHGEKTKKGQKQSIQSSTQFICIHSPALQIQTLLPLRIGREAMGPNRVHHLFAPHCLHCFAHVVSAFHVLINIMAQLSLPSRDRSN